MEEVWIDIKDYEGLYMISSCGNVKSLGNNKNRKEKIKKTFERNEHLAITLHKKGVKETFQIHILVAQAFIPNPENKPIVHHIDHNPLNNNVDNLMWVTEEQHKALHPEVKTAPKTVIQYTVDGQFVKEWKSLQEIEKELGYSSANICNCCNNKKRYKTAYNYKWKYQ